MTPKKSIVTNRGTEVAKLVPTNVLRILNLNIEQQSERYERTIILCEVNTLHNIIRKHLQQLEVENEENLSKLGLSNSVHKNKVQSDDCILDQIFTVTFY